LFFLTDVDRAASTDELEPEWNRMLKQEPTGWPQQFRDRLRSVCEAVVEAEYAWEEYTFMIEGNLLATNGNKSGTQVIDAFQTLRAQSWGAARNIPEILSGGNDQKVARANE
jgi:hypothetical protein